MTIRSFPLNSPEAEAALCPPRERPWIANGALPPDPPPRQREVIACAERGPTVKPRRR